MIGSTRSFRVHAFSKPVDMRKSFDTLSAVVTENMNGKLTSGDMFLFVSKDCTRAKVLFWDGTGLCLYSKRLERGRFAAPWKTESEKALTLTSTELALFLEGCRLVGKVSLSPPEYVQASSGA